MKMISLEQELKSNDYPGRGIIIGRSPDGKKRQQPILSWEEAKTAGTASLWRMETESVPRRLNRIR